MIWALIPNPVKRALAWLLAGLAAVWAIRVGAKREVRQQTALEAAEAIAKSEIKRGKIEDEIQTDVDLVSRARRAGVVRHTEH